MNSALGKYSQLVAAIVALAIVGVFLVSALLTIGDTTVLEKAFWVAIGAVFTAAAVTNGWKQVVAQQQQLAAAQAEQVNAIHARLDALGAQPAAQPATTTLPNGLSL